MKLGISGQVLGTKYNLKDTLDFIRDLGGEYIEIWPINIGKDGGSYSSYSAEQLREARAILDASGIKAYCVSYAGAFSRGTADDAEKYAKELCDTVEAANILGAKLVNHYCYYLSLDALDRDRLVKSMTPALELAKKYGITMTLENEAHDFTKNPEGTVEIMKLFGDDSFRTNYDATNYYQAEVEGFPHAYETLKPYIGYIHLKNASLGGGFHYTSIDEGAVNIRAIILRSKADGYDGVYTIEPHCKADEIEAWLKKDADTIKDMNLL